ncbi:MAG: hypothetical protein ACI865_002082 [Flavobacteriaceae bacterium]|jgi:hypothetical protein
MRTYCIAIFCLISLASQAQDSTFYKSAYGGGYIVVPENETWEIDRAFVNDGNAYSIQISNSNFDATYHAGDTIHTPYYIAEMELLSDKQMVQYQFYFKQK